MASHLPNPVTATTSPSSPESSPDSKLVVVKIFTRVLVPDVEYKTLSISRTTTSREVIHMLLSKFRLKHRDPNLFFLTIDVWIRKTGTPIRSVMVLEDRTCPAQLQAVCPQQQGNGAKLTLQMRRGGLVKVDSSPCFNSCTVSSATPYRSILLSDRTTAEELIQLVLNANHSQESTADFSLYQVSRSRGVERRVGRKDIPLRMQQEWHAQDLLMFRLKRVSESERADDLPLRSPCSWSRVMEETRVSPSFGYKFKAEPDEVSTSGSSDSLSTVRSTAASSSSTHSSSSDYDNFYL